MEVLELVCNFINTISSDDVFVIFFSFCLVHLERGYYRCSSSRGCPARKQVERSRVDPTVLLVTYASDHNHPLPVSSPSRCHHRGRSVAESPAVSTGSPPAEVHADELSGFSCHPDVGGDPLIDLDWLAADVASTSLLESPAWAGEPHELGADVAVAYGVMREEDETLFGDLGELPECTAVFRWRKVEEPPEVSGLEAGCGAA